MSIQARVGPDPDVLVLTWISWVLAIAGTILVAISIVMILAFAGVVPGKGTQGSVSILVFALPLGLLGGWLVSSGSKRQFRIDRKERTVTIRRGLLFSLPGRDHTLRGVESVVISARTGNDSGTAYPVFLLNKSWDRPLELVEADDHTRATMIATTVAEFLAIPIDDHAGKWRKALDDAIENRDLAALARAVDFKPRKKFTQKVSGSPAGNASDPRSHSSSEASGH